MKFIMAQSMLAEVTHRSIDNLMDTVKVYSLLFAFRTVGARHSEQFSSPRFCIFTRHLEKYPMEVLYLHTRGLLTSRRTYVHMLA
jgi:hypothetical protein